jgi:mannan endo-1,4-beta-mannosidase
MAAHFRALDANHLLTIGEEGFYAAGGAAANPGAANGSDWAARAGQDFIADHEAVDYATIHVWYAWG